jgi:hypothetical protein
MVVVDGKRFYVIFRAWITSKSGERLYAKDYGRKAWRLLIPAR